MTLWADMTHNVFEDIINGGCKGPCEPGLVKEGVVGNGSGRQPSRTIQLSELRITSFAW